MYVVTFYSYKGGVGRTMALANVAYMLAAAGKRVLAVDFDLEAPGLSSYGPFRCAEAHSGLVEYVRTYIDDNEAPDAADYIVECKAATYPIWLMPAGCHTDPGYAANYSSINWQSLYAERDGFLLFEDLRQQWSAYDGVGFDYVLIDSRTGHTDIGGICTRQLPDAVVIQFLPTLQNIEGLRPILRGIRQEGAPVRRDRVSLHFCPSNLPDLDDQELILKSLLETSENELRYDRSAAEIHHYGALDLLQQPIYAMSKPESRLAKEYDVLRQAIIGHNLEDRDGAVIALDRHRRDFIAALREDKKPEQAMMLADAGLIAARFPQDVEINWCLARLAAAMTRPEDELLALNVILEVSTTDTALALLRRARAQATLDIKVGAVEDLTRLLTQESATSAEVTPACELLRRLQPNGWRETTEAAALNARLDGGARAQLLQELMTDRNAIPTVLELSRRAAAGGEGENDPLRLALVLALIADGRFEEATSTIVSDRARLLTSSFMPAVFNYAVSEWAARGQPPEDLFSRVLSLRAHQRYHDSNALQCFALCRYVLNQHAEALDDLRRAQLSAQRVSSVFSCWRYLNASSKEMQIDLDEMMDLFVRQVPLRPPERDGLKGANAT